MGKLIILFLALSYYALLLTSCTEVSPLVPPASPDLSTKCYPPSIEKNVVGNWWFESTYNEIPGSITKGSIIFNKDGTIVDPDFLFSYILSGTDAVITKKTYSPKVVHTEPNLKGEFFEVYLNTKYGVSVHYFELISNECNRIHFRRFKSKGGSVGFTLTRK